MTSPCQLCGACCVTYRITMPKEELDIHPMGKVPAKLTEPYTLTTVCMREHPDHPQRCIALEGIVGVAVNCTIHERRPQACAEFAPLAALGMGDDACNEARRRHGLRTLA